MVVSSEYVDYDIYLDSGFDPIKFANSLVLATNNPSDADVDLSSASKRLGYDLEEVDKLIKTISTENHEQLLAKADDVIVAQSALDIIKENLDSVNTSYAKLYRDIISPYEKSQKMHAALRRVHLTSSLLRILTWYLHLARQLDSLMKSSSVDALYQSVQTIKQLQQLVQKNPALNSLHIVRSHSQSLSDQTSRARSQCLHVIRDFSLAQDMQQLSYACLALYLLDPKDLTRCISAYLKSQTSASSTQLIRSLSGSLLEFEGAANDSRSRARALNALVSVLKSAKVDEKDLLSYVISSMDTQSLVSSYWRDIASAIDSKLRELMLRNPTTTRQLQSNASKMKDIVRTSVFNGGGVLVNGLEVKVMMNCFSIITR